MAFPRPRRVTASSAANLLFANCMYFCLFLIFPISEDIRFISCHCFIAVVSFVFEVNTVHPSENIVLWFNTRNSKTLFSSFLCEQKCVKVGVDPNVVSSINTFVFLSARLSVIPSHLLRTLLHPTVKLEVKVDLCEDRRETITTLIRSQLTVPFLINPRHGAASHTHFECRSC